MCLEQGHNAVMLVRLEPTAPQSRVKHSTTEPLCSLINVFSAAIDSTYCALQADRTHLCIVKHAGMIYMCEVSSIEVQTKRNLKIDLLFHDACITKLY